MNHRTGFLPRGRFFRWLATGGLIGRHSLRFAFEWGVTVLGLGRLAGAQYFGSIRLKHILNNKTVIETVVGAVRTDI